MAIELKTSEDVQNAILRIKENLKAVNESDYNEEDKRNLKNIYSKNLRKFKLKQLSFYCHILN